MPRRPSPPVLSDAPGPAEPSDTGRSPDRGPRSGAARKARARSPGRPAGEAGDVRARLLDAGVRCYARAGIAATSLRDVATEAGVTPALLNYYFGGKDALQAAVFAERVQPLVARFRTPLADAPDDLRATLQAFVRAVIETALAHPWLPQLWVREVLQEGGRLRAHLQSQIGAALPKALVARFVRAQAAGALNPRLDPRLLVPSIMGQTMFLVAAAPIWRQVFDAADVDADALARHVLALLESGMEMPA